MNTNAILVNTIPAKPHYFVIGIVFLASRLTLLPHPQPTSDVPIYARYVREYYAAKGHGESFYEFHARTTQPEKSRVAGKLAASTVEYEAVEYPPLAIAFMLLPSLWTNAAPDSADFDNHYLAAYRTGLA